MSSYVGKIQVGSNGEQILIGSTLFGSCSTLSTTPAKVVTLDSFDSLVKGVTVHVRFTNGNSVATNLTLKVGSTHAKDVEGNCVCNSNDVIAFTYWEETIGEGSSAELISKWYVNNNIVVTEGSNNGTIIINGQEVNIHGLGSAAYTATTDYATSAQGTKADNAMPKTGGTFSGAILGPQVTDSSDSASLATVGYVLSKTAGLSGLTGAMHYKGTTTTAITDGGTQNPTINGDVISTKESGDVVLYGEQEFVWNGSAWELLGDEGSYVLKTSQTQGSVGSASGWSAGSASNAVVSSGVLQLTNSTIPSLTVTSTNVIVPATTT